MLFRSLIDDSIVSKLDAILLKRHIPIPSSSSINSHHVDKEVPSDTMEELVSVGSSQLSSEVPPLPITHGAAQAVWLSSRPVSASEFLAKQPPLVTTRGGASGFARGVSH